MRPIAPIGILVFFALLLSTCKHTDTLKDRSSANLSKELIKKYPQIPPKALQEALLYLEKNPTDFPNKQWITLIDYSKISNQERFHLIDLKNLQLESFLTSHGRGSDPKHTGRAQKFGDQVKSNMSSLGFFKTGETYYGKHGYSLKLHGLSPSNQNAFKRTIVIHAADYVNKKLSPIGRSHGCPALPKDVSKQIIDKIKDGSLIYAFN
jgi:hypothetical protein